MSARFDVGSLVKMRVGTTRDEVGIVSQPISQLESGHVLILADRGLHGMTVSYEDVIAADEESEGFAQLANNLIKLGSHVIEERLIVYAELTDRKSASLRPSQPML